MGAPHPATGARQRSEGRADVPVLLDMLNALVDLRTAKYNVYPEVRP
jgi:hypothetical protein